MFETWNEIYETARTLAKMGYKVVITGWSGEYMLWLQID